MTAFQARIRLVVDVPFEFNVPVLEHESTEITDSETIYTAGNEEAVLTARSNAAIHAESKLVEWLKNHLPDSVKIVNEMVEEVHESDAL